MIAVTTGISKSLAFPLPEADAEPPPMPLFAFPPPPLPSARSTTVRMRRSPFATGLEELAAWVDAAPMPELSEGTWAFLSRFWFFFAGATVGVLFAASLIAVFGVTAAPVKTTATMSSDATKTAIATAAPGARALVILRPAMVADRGDEGF